MKRIAAAVLLVIIGVPLLIIFWGLIALHLADFFGFQPRDANGSHYLFWSGAGSDLAYLSGFGAFLIYYRKNNCKKAWCPFIGYHDFTDPKDGITRKLCWVHHPDVRHKTLHSDTIREIQQRHHLHFGKQPGKG